MIDLAELLARLSRQGCDQAKKHLEQARSALERREWESANAQLRTFLEALFNQIAHVRLGTNKTGGEARKKLQSERVLGERDGKLVQAFMDAAGASGAHAGSSTQDEAQGRFLIAVGIALVGLSLMPELTRVEDILQLELTFRSPNRAPTDAEITTTCPSCGTVQTLSEARIYRNSSAESVYECQQGCQAIVVIGSPGSKAIPNRGMRLGNYVVRNAGELRIPVIGGDKPIVMRVPAMANALIRAPLLQEDEPRP